MGKKRAVYDDDALVEMIVEGALTYKAIGEKLGISEGLVKKIALGRRRKDLSVQLWEADDGLLAEARRVGGRFAKFLMMKQVRLGLKGKGESARRAREFLLKFAMSAHPRREDLPKDRQRRPEHVLRNLRVIGEVPWEDELDAQRESEAAECLPPLPAATPTATKVPPSISSMAAAAVMPAGETARG